MKFNYPILSIIYIIIKEEFIILRYLIDFIDSFSNNDFSIIISYWR